MKEDIVARLRELTDVDFERDSTKPESELSSLCSLLSQFIENEMRSCSMDVGGIMPEYVQRASLHWRDSKGIKRTMIEFLLRA